jgi:RNase adapter protein RapZ
MEGHERPRSGGQAVSEFLVVTGLSGAGRSTTAASLEDIGWFVIDNLPATLVPKVAELVGRPGSETERVALVIGRGGGERLEDVPAMLDTLRASRNRVRMLFLDAPDEVLVRRFEGTRRRHPVGSRGVEEAVADERKLLAPLRADADIVLDTGELNPNQLRNRILEIFASEGDGTGMQTSILSFGYKHGVPLDVDLLFDCRFLPNPYWSEDLRSLSGLDAPVRQFVLSQPETTEFLGKVDDLLTMLMPAFVREGKSYLTVAIGCTGGRHRSVALAQALAERLGSHGISVSVFHRDIDR